MPPLVLAIAGALVLVANVVLLARIPEFAWDKFFLVFRWTLLAYLVFAGILEFVFVYDHTPGRQRPSSAPCWPCSPSTYRCCWRSRWRATSRFPPDDR